MASLLSAMATLATSASFFGPRSQIQKGYHLYYPSRRQLSPAFGAFVGVFRYRSR
ncbi:hypothetical protein ABIA20_001107 [Sinorhizobium fredii]